MNNKVMLVGGAGYVGCVLTEELLAKGYSVRILDRVFFGHKPIERLMDRVELIVEDMRDLDEGHLEDCRAVINLGGLSNDPTAEFNPKANKELNTDASIRVAEIARKAHVPTFIFASSCSIYDRGVESDARDVLLDEEADVQPRAAYASSKLAAEQEILKMSDRDFAVTALRKGTIHGFSPRMRYDLVVNTFVKDALAHGEMTIHTGGELWRPVVDIKDVARAYVMVLESDPEAMAGQVFNVAAGNFRISELALRVQQALRNMGVDASLNADYSYRLVRNYRVSTDKIAGALNFRPRVTIEESVEHMVKEIRAWGYQDFTHPRYYNIEWMKLLEEAASIVGSHGYVLTKPEIPGDQSQVAHLSQRTHNRERHATK